MVEFIVNPRRAPRAPARCRAAVLTSEGGFDAETEDIGAMGCQLVSPKIVRKGDLVRLQITHPKLQEPLSAGGRVAWVGAQAPWRVGVAFDEVSQGAAARWFELVVAATPGLGGYRRVPERIPTDAVVYLGPPPRFLVDFTADEATLLRAIASGARVDELEARLRDTWPSAQRALFSLIARQVVTFQRGHAVHPDSWKRILSEVEAALAVEQLEQEPPALRSAPLPPPPPPPAPAAAPRVARPSGASELDLAPGTATPVPVAHGAVREGASWGAEPLDPSPRIDLPPDDGPPLEIAGPGPAGLAGAGVGWRAARARSAEAQAAYDRALDELRSGTVTGAIGLLRRALALAPGDPEIAKALGDLAFRDRRGAP